MNVVKVSVTGVGSTNWVQPDWKINPFAVAVYVVVTGTATYTIQDTPIDTMNVSPVPAAAIFSHPTLVNLSASANGNYAFPTLGIRGTITAGTGSIDVYIIQSDGI